MGPLAAAELYLTAGLSCFPAKANGSKEPLYAGWRDYAVRRPTRGDLAAWFDRPHPPAVAVAGGPASGNLIVLDFEGPAPYPRWLDRLAPAARTWVDGCPLVATPTGGRHLYVRTTEPVKGAKYARDVQGKCLVEARGSQHFVIAPGSPDCTHPTNRPYTFERRGWLDGPAPAPVPLDVFLDLITAAAELNEYVRPARVVDHGPRAPREEAAGDRPGDRYNARTEWADLLPRFGWRACRRVGGTVYWTRPGKAAGVSASTGFCRGERSGDLFYVFSSSAPPFEADTAYSRFAVYTLLRHRGDYRAAARALSPRVPARARWGEAF